MDLDNNVIIAWRSRRVKMEGGINGVNGNGNVQ